MPQFVVAVLTTLSSPSATELLDQYDGNRQVPPYVAMTREQILTHQKTAIEMELSSYRPSGSTRAILSHVGDTDEELLAWFFEDKNHQADEQGNLVKTKNPMAFHQGYHVYDTMTVGEWLDTCPHMTDRALHSEWLRLTSAFPNMKCWSSWQKERYLSGERDDDDKRNFGIQVYGTEETFFKMSRMPLGRAIVTPDGSWHEPHLEVSGYWRGSDVTKVLVPLDDWPVEFENIKSTYEDDEVTVTLAICNC